MSVFDWLKQRRQVDSKSVMSDKNNYPPGPPATEIRPMRHVRKLLIRGAMNVVFHRGEEPQLKVDCENQGDLHKIITRFREDTLVVEMPETNITITSNNGKGSSSVAIQGANYGVIMNGKQLVPSISILGYTVVHVTLPAIREVVSEGAGNVRLSNLMQADINIVAAGSGKITAHGNVRFVDIAVSGCGDVDASGLMADVGKLSVCGSGEIEAFIRESLTARISGAGDIVVGGNPKQRNARIEGSGDVRFR